MLFSKKCEYAIRALNHLVQSRQVCKASEISRDQQVPYPYMAKVLQELKRKGFVKSARGGKGGYALAKPAHKMRLIDVLTTVDGDHVLSSCLYGFSGCSENVPCPLHDSWKILRGDIETYLCTQTIAGLGKQKLKGVENPRKRKKSASR
ncbi:MAG: Rrf2 family transcriptional regulator [Acidobacteria bacterium]|nr:Rrf2 family transcriptional regulator [Acidobacteriota bacterium]